MTLENQSMDQSTVDLSPITDRSERVQLSVGRIWSFGKEIAQIYSRQEEILIKVFSRTIASDKTLRLTGNIIKWLRNKQVLKNSKSLEQLSLQVLQLRRLLRVNRLVATVRDLLLELSTPQLASHEICFKIFQLISDLMDMWAYAARLKLFSAVHFSQHICDMYFAECVYLFLNHIYKCLKSFQVINKTESFLIGLKYALDSVVSYQDFSRRRGKISSVANLSCGLLSALINLYLVWK